MTDEDLEKRIDAAIREKVALGWRIRDGLTLNEDSKFCCPLGAIGAPTSMELGRPYGFVRGFIAGFDGRGGYGDGFKMGARFRARWMAGEYSKEG